MEAPQPPGLETDPRFPSGPWVGFFLDRRMPGKHKMELRLSFHEGLMRGDGADRIGKFLVRGGYETSTGKAWWSKRYVGAHDVSYSGYNEGKGIWGVWEMPNYGLRGGFHIWPEAMGDPTLDRLRAEVEVPAEAPPVPAQEEEKLVPAGAE